MLFLLKRLFFDFVGVDRKIMEVVGREIEERTSRLCILLYCNVKLIVTTERYFSFASLTFCTVSLPLFAIVFVSSSQHTVTIA